MGSEWTETTLGELCERQGGSIQTGPFGSQLHASDYQDAGTPVVMPVNLVDGRVSEAGIARVGEAHVSKLTRHKLLPGDIVFSRRGDVTRFALITERESGWLCGTGCLKVSLGEQEFATAEFVAGILSLPESKEWLVQHAVGATMPNLNTSILSALPVRIPDLAIQRSATSLLTALTARMERLRQTNATLEAIAQALFKSWFVDFDPVRAKAEGREPEGMDATTAVLFTSEFEDSELGVIPKDWKSVRLADLCSKIQNGATPSRKNGDFWEGGTIPWFKTGELADGFLEESSELITEEALGKTSVKVLPRHAVLMAIYAAPTVGRLGVLTRESAFNQACTGMIAKTDVGPWFLFQTLRHGRDWFNSRANGAAQQNISKSIVESLPCIKPPAELLAAFSKIAGALYRLAEANSQRIEILSNLRDALLPRLIFGKLRLPESEREIEAPTA